MGEHDCKYCGGYTRNADGICTHCGSKLVLIRKIKKIGERIKRDAEMENALRQALWKGGDVETDGKCCDRGGDKA